MNVNNRFLESVCVIVESESVVKFLAVDQEVQERGVAACVESFCCLIVKRKSVK